MLAADLDALVGKIVGLFGTAEDQIAGAISSQLSAQLGDGGQDVGSAVLNQLGQQLAGALLEHAGGILGVRTAVESILRSVLGQLGSTLSAAFLGAVEGGADTAVAEASELRRAARHAKHGSHAIMPDAPSATARASKRDKLVQDLIRQFQPQLDRRLRLTHAQVLRSAEDIYRKAVAAGAMGATPGASGPDQLTRRQATQRTLDDLWQRGISGFVDARGRQWNLATYVEMATRTALAQASAQAHLDMMGVEGFDLCQVSDSPHECPKCRPWEGKVLTRDNSGAGGKTLTLDSELDGDPVEVEVAGSVSEAIAAGLLHPNAILGAQPAQVLGEVENAVRAWYDGPSVNLTTSRGHRLTVSPNHPVLTTRGWLRADLIRQGDQVLSGVARRLADKFAITDIALNDMPSTFEDIFQALFAVGRKTSVAATRRDFHGDGRSYKGKVDVVWTEGALLRVVQSGLIEQLDEQFFVRTDVQLSSLTGVGPQGGALWGIGGAVGRALSDLDATCFESAQQGRVTDAEDWRQVLAGFSADVAPDEIVNVDRGWYSGHAYDLQTSTGAYLTDGIIVHNCTHRFITYLAGLTRPLTNTQNAKGYEATQTQRGLEREARRIRVQIKGAVSPSHVKDLKAKLKGQSQAIEDHLAANPTLVRKPERELPNLGHVPSPVDPTKAPVKVAPVSKLKAVQVKKVAAPVKAKKAPVKKAPVKKATVTAPRKPAAKSTLAPKVRPPKSTPPRAVKAAAPTASAFAKRPTFDQPVLSEGELKSVYGPRMTVNRAGKDPARLAVQLRGLGQIDKGLHKRMNGFLGEEQYGGIYLGPKGILDTAPVEMRANFHGQPRGYPAGSTYNDVRGCYVPHEHALLIGDDQHPLDGTHSTAQHEFGHAVDHMEGHPSRSQEYKDVYDSLKSSITFKPYFSATGNPSGYHSESFAEFFNAYASQRGKPEQVMVRVMMGQLGFAPAANDIAYAVIKGPEEIARLPRGAREGLVAMRKLIAMLDDITEGKR